MSFVQKKIGPEQGFGADLRQLRELRGWTREALERATGIHKNTICLLEEERLDELNDPAYAERHVRSLVSALEGRVGFFLEKYRLALERLGKKTGQDNFVFARRIKKSDLFVPSKYLILVAIILVVGVLGWYVAHQAGHLTASPQLEILEPADHAVINNSLLRVRGKTDPTASISINGQSAVVETDGSFDISFDVPRGTTRLDVAAKRRYGGEVEIVRYVTYNQSATSTSALPEQSATTTK